MCNVTPFKTDLGAVSNIPLSTIAVAYDDPLTFGTYILIFNESLQIPGLNHYILCPSQMRDNDVLVNEVPLQYLPKHLQNETSYTIQVGPLTIPLTLHGIHSNFLTRLPSDYELAHPHLFPQVIMTADRVWEPHDPVFNMHESTLRTSLQYVRHTYYSNRNISKINLVNISDALCPHTLHTKMSQTVLVPYNCSAVSYHRHGTPTASELAKRWFIGLQTAARTLEHTTQRGVRDFTKSEGTRRLRHSTYQLMYRHLRSSVYTDTMFASVKSLQGNKCAQVYCTWFQWVVAYPIPSKAEAHHTLDRLHRDYGIFHTIIPDNAKELTAGEFKRKALKAGSYIAPIEAYSHNQNLAESAIRELQRMFRKAMRQTNAPYVLWDYCIELMSKIRSHTALDMLILQGDTPHTFLTGDTSDISHICEFSWYDMVWYVDHLDKLQNRKLGRYLGPSYDIGQAMASKILTSKGQVLSRTSVFPITIEDTNSEAIKEQMKSYEQDLKNALGDRMEGLPIENPETDDIEADIEYEPYEDDENQPIKYPDAEDIDLDTHHKFISAQVAIPVAGELQFGKVIGRKRDKDGRLIGKPNSNPLLDTTLYDVELADGHIEAYAANQIAESIYSQVDNEGIQYALLDEILDHKRLGDAVSGDDGYIMKDGREIPRKTTKGWKLLIKWKDGSTQWVRLADLKESNPVDVAEYAVGNKLVNEPAFKWWVPYVMKKRDRIISAVKTRYLRKEQKFGIELPKSAKEAIHLDQESGTTLWQDAIKKEMSVILPAVKILDEGAPPPIGFQRIPCHLVFDVKIDFTRKARFVAGGHVTSPPATQTYASVVSRESVRIAFLLASLNDMDVLSADVQGAYLNAPCHEKVYTTCGMEFGIENVGRVAVIVKALYGLKTSAFAWREHLSQTLTKLGFKFCVADNDVWLRGIDSKSQGKLYEYVLVYTDDILCISLDPANVLNCINQHYLLKPDSIGVPKTYLGAEVSEY
jgi:Reverse transcriptase (RNA-dependent DNA polymerase)